VAFGIKRMVLPKPKESWSHRSWTTYPRGVVPVAAQIGRKLGRIIPHHFFFFFNLLPSDFRSCLLVPRLNEKPDSKGD